MSMLAPSLAPSRGPSTAPVVGLRIHTRAEVTPAWTDEVALPVWIAARAGGRHLIGLRRGWVGGPHVEIFDASGGQHGPDWAALAPGSAQIPLVGDQLDGAAYLDAARERGRLENVAPPYLPFRAHGEVVPVHLSGLIRADRPLDALRGLISAALSPATVASVTAVSQRPTAAPSELIAILTCIADAHVMGPGFGTFSLRSHAEAMLQWLSPKADLRPRFAARLDEQRAAIRDQVAAALEGRAGHRWATGLAYSRGLIDERVQRGELTDELLDEVGQRPTGREGPDGEALRTDDEHPDTDFHRTVHGSGATRSAGAWFAGYRFLVNSAYAQLPLLDISPLQRTFGCYAVAEVIDELLGESWTQRLASAADDTGRTYS